MLNIKSFNKRFKDRPSHIKMMNTEETKEFEVNDNSPIGFGKLRGKEHKLLLTTQNKEYAKWIMDQGEDFRYSATRQYIIDNLDKGDVVELFSAVKVIERYYNGEMTISAEEKEIVEKKLSELVN